MTAILIHYFVMLAGVIATGAVGLSFEETSSSRFLSWN